jgi:DtxR family Mn-dependent transcriptional regulator
MDNQRAIDEILEFVWAEKEDGRSSIKELLCIDEIKRTGGDEELLQDMERARLIQTHGDEITLTSAGEHQAEQIIRRHRLAERLLTDILDVRDEETLESHACNFEHTLSSTVANSICTLLGHPPTCPHGLPIPKGDCCAGGAGAIDPLIKPLTEFEVGEAGRIVFIIPKTHARLDRLGAMGLVPGSLVRLHQKKPAYVIELGETTLALDPEIVAEIYVKREG